MEVVPERTAQTLVPLIQQWCLPGTHIISDGWAAYSNLSQLNGGVYLHDVVVHQENFVDPLHPEIHTQNVENLWMRAKRKLCRQFGTTRQLFDTYLREFVCQVRHKGHQHRLAALLVCIRQQYPCWAETEEKKTVLFRANHITHKELLPRLSTTQNLYLMN